MELHRLLMFKLAKDGETRYIQINEITRIGEFMKKYSMFHIPVFSFFSAGLYRDACLNWRGTCLSYLFLLLIICWIPYTIKLHLGLSNFILDEAPKFTSQIPKMTISGGELTADVNQPYMIIDPKSKKILFIIDTTGKTVGIDDSEAIGLVTRSEVTIRKNKYEKRTFDLKTIDNFSLDKQRVTGWLEAFRKYFAVSFFPLALTTSLVFRIFQVLIYACIGMLFAVICNSKRSYISLLRISVLAVTPCIIIRTVLELSGINIPFAGLWFLIMTMVYLFIGVKASSRQEEPQQDTDIKSSTGI